MYTPRTSCGETLWIVATNEGKNALGGAIKLFSKRPTNELRGFLEAGYVTCYDYGCLNRWIPIDALDVNIAYDTSRDRDETSASTLLQAINPRGQPNTDYGRFVTSQRFVNYATFCVPELSYCIPPVSNSNDWGVTSTIDYTFSPTVSLKSIPAIATTRRSFRPMPAMVL